MHIYECTKWFLTAVRLLIPTVVHKTRPDEWRHTCTHAGTISTCSCSRFSDILCTLGFKAWKSFSSMKGKKSEAGREHKANVHSSRTFLPNPGFGNGWINYSLASQVSCSIKFFHQEQRWCSFFCGRFKFKDLLGLALFFHLTTVK